MANKDEETLTVKGRRERPDGSSNQKLYLEDPLCPTQR
jgi:hypothetical protein